MTAAVDARPGGLAALACKVSDAGAKVTILCMATGDRVVIGADNLAVAEAAISGT